MHRRRTRWSDGINDASSLPVVDGNQLPRRNRRMRRRKNMLMPQCSRLAALLVVLSMTIIALLASAALIVRICFYSTSPHETAHLPHLDELTSHFRDLYLERQTEFKTNQQLYDLIQRLSDQEIDYDQSATEWPEYERRPHQLGSEYAQSVAACSVTFVLLDPRLGFSPQEGYGPGKSAWFSLESIAAFAPPNSCVLLQTSHCHLVDLVDINERQTTVFDRIYNNSLPLFRRHIESGKVRVTFLDHVKYNLQSCSDYGNNPSPALMNTWYWKDEFVETDSDHVIMVQDDVVLCHPMDVQRWKDFAYIGAVWTREATPLTPEPMEGACRAMPARWNSWLMPQRRWEKQQQGKPVKWKPVPEPQELLSLNYPKVCDDGQGPIGNGGFSWRSRRWMIKAIDTCPHVKYSGLELADTPLACKVFDWVNEDLYFGTLLRGLGAPVPSAFDAALFSTEMLWPEQVVDMYGKTVDNQTSTNAPYVMLDKSTRLTIPAGFHKPWWYHSNRILFSDEVSNACFFLPYIFKPTMSKWNDFSATVT